MVGAMFSGTCSGCLWGVGCFNGSRASGGLSPPPRQASPLINVPKARMVLTSAVGGGESLSPIPGLPGVGDGGIRVRGGSKM